jgi:hypothetical protein
MSATPALKRELGLRDLTLFAIACVTCAECADERLESRGGVMATIIKRQKYIV